MKVSDEINSAALNVCGGMQFSVSNYKGIIEYTQTSVRINTKDFVVNIFGADFEISYISDEEVCAIGKIEKIEFVY